LNVLLVVPEIRIDDKPFDFPFWAGIFASIIDQKGGNVAILDLNALRMNYGGNYLSLDNIKKQIDVAKWDLIGIGGLTTTYSRMKQLSLF
jgi:anaerobic magnesium-protoporphyrin IX monomethyl ester cyclase